MTGMLVVGLCRFSMLGRGDWVGYRRGGSEPMESLVDRQAEALFDPARLETRLATFEHLTLASIAAQDQRDLLFLVFTSDRLPGPALARLRALCDRVPAARLCVVPPMHVTEAQAEVEAELGIDRAATIQFRLDDDDCLSSIYVRRLREAAQALSPQFRQFAVSFPDLIYAMTDGDAPQVHHWHQPFFSAGAAVVHPQRSVFDFGHFAIPTRMPAFTQPGVYALATFDGSNDSAPNIARIRRRQFEPFRPGELDRILGRQFGFLGPEGLRLAGLDRIPADRTET